MSNLYKIDVNDVQRIATKAIESYIKTLEDEGVLSESADYILANYSIVTYEKGFWGSLVEKIFGIDKEQKNDSIYMRTVKHIYHKKQRDDPSGSQQRNLKLVERLKDKD